MEEKDYSNENIIVIESLNDYLSAISEIRERVKETEGLHPSNQQFYFRGQANSAWEIIPSVYRGNLLANEPELIRSAYLRNPVEFRTFTSSFERLTKLQHYGLPTRLLDVTTNPLVALYFACQLHDEIQENEETGIKEVKSTDGAVFYKRTYGRGFQDVEIETISFLASESIPGDLTLESCLELLTEKGIYSSFAANNCRTKKYNSLIQSLQNNYFVISTLNNDRLIRQSGAFLLPGHYNIFLDPTDIGKSLIQRASSSLTDEFEEEHFVIPCGRKPEILEELDLYNINEGALFPELEHQMAYIKQRRLTKDMSHLGQFSKVSKSEGKEKPNGEIPFLDDADAVKIFETVLPQHISSSYLKEVLESLKADLCIDWYQKESAVSTMRLHLTKLLSSKPDFNRHSASEKSKEIMDAILLRIKQ